MDDLNDQVTKEIEMLNDYQNLKSIDGNLRSSSQVVKDNEDYDLVRRLFTSQELHQGISDREFGLLPSVNRVLTKELADLTDLKVRSSVQKLNSQGGSFCLDLLNESELTDLLQVETSEQAA